MGLTDRLKNIAFQPEQVDEPVAPPRPSRPSYRPVTPRAEPVGSAPISMIGGRVPEDPEMALDIDAALAKCVRKGYTELLTQLRALEAAIPDEGARIAAAIASLGAVLQLRPEDIRAAVDERMGALQQHKVAFESGINGEVATTRQQYQQSHDAARKRLVELAAETAKLQRDVADYEKELSDIEAKSITVKASYEATFARRYDELNGLLARIR